MKKIIFIILAILLTIAGYILIFPESVGYCLPYGCINSFRVFSLGQPLFFGMLPITLTFLIFLFIKAEKTNWLYKIFIPYFIVSAGIISILPQSCNVFTPICPSKAGVAILLGIAYLIYSIAYIIRYKPKNI